MRKGRGFFCSAVVLILGILYFFSYRLLVPEWQRAAASADAYAVLAVDEDENDSLVRESLAGIGDFISESSQEILIDDFGSFKKVPLDRYSGEIESFDPRDDGYAAKVRAFFVRDGKRFFFLPLDDSASDGFRGSRAEKLTKDISGIMGDKPHSFSVLRKESVHIAPIVLFAAACGASWCLARSRRLFLYIMPALLAFGWQSSAFVPAGLLAGFWELLREPCGELFASRCYKRRFTAMHADYPGSGLRGTFERLAPFRLNFVLAFLFAVLFAGFSAAQGLFPFPSALGMAAFPVFCFLSFGAGEIQIRDKEHILFIPVMLPPFRVKTFRLFPFLLPFGLGALLALLLPLFLPEYTLPGPAQMFTAPQYLVSAEDYSRHLAFQESFSYASLNGDAGREFTGGPEDNAEALMRKDYLRYYLGDDGLISTREPGGNTYSDITGAGAEKSGMARFPLEKLMDFLVQYHEGDSPVLRSSAARYFPVQRGEWISLAIIFFVFIVDLAGPGKSGGKKKKAEEYGDKRIAA